MKMNQYFLMMIICFSLTACATRSAGSAAQSSDQTGNYPNNASVTAYLKNHPDAMAQLTGSGVKVLRIGDFTRFVVPSSLLFSDLGARIQTAAYPALDQVIAMIKAIPKETITVKAYSFSNNSTRVAMKITALQAQAVSDYLMSHGVNTRLIYTFGMGNTNKVTQSPDRLLENYRVEITLKTLHTRLSA